MQTAKLFANGKSQAVRLPKEFRFEGDEVIVKRVGNGVMPMPLRHSAKALRAILDGFDPDFRIKREQPRRRQKRPRLR